MKNTFYITTPIYYVNSKPHIGSAYTTVACDIMARFKKLDGYDVKFLTGTDEHGQKVEQSAKKAGKEPQEFVDEISEKFVDLVKLMNCKPSVFDYLGKYKRSSGEEENFSFIRTTNPKHKKVVQDVWRKLEENGWIYKGKYSGYYCVSDEAYYDESELIKGEDGKLRTELGKEAEWKEEETYFFRLGEFQEILLALYKYYPNFVQPDSRRNEVIAFVSGLSIKDLDAGEKPKEGHLKDLSISRNSFEWGVPVPNDKEHVMYVWLDALFNYVSALGGVGSEDYERYWKGEKTYKEISDNSRETIDLTKEDENHIVNKGMILDKTPKHSILEKVKEEMAYQKGMDRVVMQLNKTNDVVHVVGKEILRFHAVYWPAFLIAYKYSREELKSKTIDVDFIEELLQSGILPTKVFAHGFWEADGKKMSKSFGNVVVADEEIEWLKTEYNISHETAVDYLRYYLMNEMPFGNDGDFSRERFVTKINSELVNNIGNLAQRTLSMIYKNCDGKIPTPQFSSEERVEERKTNSEIANYDAKSGLTYLMNRKLRVSCQQYMDAFEFNSFAREIIIFAGMANQYIEHEKPWELKKSDPEKLGTVLYVLVEAVRKIAILLQPFCPYSAEKLLKAVGVDVSKAENLQFDALEVPVKSGTVIDEPEGVFPRLSKGK